LLLLQRGGGRIHRKINIKMHAGKKEAYNLHLLNLIKGLLVIVGKIKHYAPAHHPQCGTTAL
jgi:hypothetical protein